MFRYKSIVAILFCLAFVSCDDFVDVGGASSQILKPDVFNSDGTAKAALSGVYSDMYNSFSGFASGTYNGVTGLCGMSGAELIYYPRLNEFLSFQNYSITPDNSNVLSLWKSMYFSVYGANSALEGIERSTNLSVAVKNQLTGEALFVRAFSYFYLVNLFGDVPLVVATNFEPNATLSRSPSEQVFSLIESDLKSAISLLTDDVAGVRSRPGRTAACTLLARFYLYKKDWSNAETYASGAIDTTGYVLMSELDGVFLENSPEAIWQLKPANLYYNTNEGIVFILNQDPMINPARPFGISDDIMSSFEVGDRRKDKWVGAFPVENGDPYYFPYKYKADYGQTGEASMVLRLAEVYLTRAEARAENNNLTGAIADLDSVRSRAGVSLISDTNPGISKDELVMVILREREVELFGEWGHRWFDLKRTGRADILLSVHGDYSEDDKLYPIPRSEFEKNPKLGLQNLGY
jgi:hypothetical protein